MAYAYKEGERHRFKGEKKRKKPLLERKRKMKKDEKKVVAMGTEGKVISLTVEQQSIYNKADLWELSAKELTDKALSTVDVNVRRTIVKILDYIDRAGSMTELDKVKVRFNSNLSALNAYLANFISENAEVMATIHAKGNMERMRQGKEPKDSSSFGSGTSKGFIFKVDGIDHPVTISANITVTSGIGKKLHRKLRQDAAWRIAMAVEADKRQAEINRLWNLYEQEGTPNKDRF